jgi:hypothetical protein
MPVTETGTATAAAKTRGALVVPEPIVPMVEVVPESVLVAANEGAANDRVSTVANPAAATATFLLFLIILVRPFLLGSGTKSKLEKIANQSRKTQDALFDLSGNCQLRAWSVWCQNQHQ